MKHLLIFLFATFFCNSVLSQTPLAEFQTPKVPRNLQAFSVGDTLFMFYDEPRLSTKVCYQVNKDGTSEKIVTKLKAGLLVMGVVKYNDELYFYYVSGEKRSLTLEASVYNETLKQEMPANKGVEIYDEIWGISTNKKSRRLELILYDSEEDHLKVVGIDSLTWASEKRFIMPEKLTDYTIEYIEESRFIPSAQGASKVKLIKTSSEIYLTIDRTMYESSSYPGTTVVKFDLENGAKTVQKIGTTSRDNFRSFVYHDVLYRSMISKKAFGLETFDITSGRLISNTTIARDTSLKHSFIYLRNSKAQSVNKGETLYGLINLGKNSLPSIVVPMQGDSCKKILVWGSYFMEEGGIGSPAGIFTNPLVGIASMIIGTAINQMVNHTGISRYLYMNLDCNNEFNRDEPIKKSIPQKIDDYEIALKVSGVVPQYKTYADSKNGCIGLYVDDHHHKLILTRFED